MLYLADDNGESWEVLTEHFARKDPVDLVVSLCPGEELDALPAPLATKRATKDLERLTTYGDEEEPPRSTRLRVDAELLQRFK